METETETFTDSEYYNRSRNRKANFSKDETVTLIEEISKARVFLFASDHSKQTSAKKRELWGKICFKINAMFGTDRESRDLKKKWKDLKRIALRDPHQESHKHSDCTRIQERELCVLKLVKEVATSTSNPFNDDEEFETSSLEMLVSTAENEGEKIEIPVDPNGKIILKSSDGEILVEENDNFTLEVNDSEQSITLKSSPTPVSVNPSHHNNPPSFPSSSYSNMCNGIRNINNNNNNRSNNCNTRNRNPESKPQPVPLTTQKLRLKVKWLESEIAKNESIVEVNRAKADYMRAKKARLES